MTPSHWTHWLYIALGGATGATLRALVYYLAHTLGHAMPWATLMVNILGSLVVGLLLGYEWFHQSLSSLTRWFLVIGFCGSFTTFSAFTWETLTWMRSSQWLHACSYTLGSFIMGLFSVAIGFKLALWSLENLKAYS